MALQREEAVFNYRLKFCKVLIQSIIKLNSTNKLSLTIAYPLSYDLILLLLPNNKEHMKLYYQHTYMYVSSLTIQDIFVGSDRQP